LLTSRTPGPLNSEELMAGQCASCRVRVETKRACTRTDSEGWGGDIAPCPGCGARVFVFPVANRAPVGDLEQENARLKEELREKTRLAESFQKIAQENRAWLVLRDQQIAELEEKVKELERGQVSLFARMTEALEKETDIEFCPEELAEIERLEAEELPPLPDGIEEEE
jgi:hypothetical protein